MNNAAQRLLTALEGEIRDAKGRDLESLNMIMESVLETYELSRCDDCKEIFDNYALEGGFCKGCIQEQAAHERDLEIASRWLDSSR